MTTVVVVVILVKTILVNLGSNGNAFFHDPTF